VAGPWYVLVGLRTDGAWLEGFLFEHNIGRAAGAMEGHGGPFVYYPIAMLVGLFPWSILCGPALVGLIRGLKSQAPWRPGYLFAACWVGVYVGLFSLASTKLPSYITPCYPGAALLIGCFLHRWTSGEPVFRLRGSRAASLILGGVGLAIAIGAPIAAHRLMPGEEWLGAIGLLLVAGAACLWRLADRHPARAGAALAIAAGSFALAVFALGAARVDRHRGHEELLGVVRARDADAPVGSYQCLEPSWVFYAGRPIDELVHRPGGDSPRAFTTTPAGERVRRNDLHGFLASDPRAVVITTDEHYEKVRGELADDVTVLAEAPYFLKGERLLLLGRRDARLADKPSPARH
jgi:4-amino-4-deoxy-L-arabinose transferase-like glycosyltransferase